MVQKSHKIIIPTTRNLIFKKAANKCNLMIKIQNKTIPTQYPTHSHLVYYTLSLIDQKGFLVKTQNNKECK